MGVQSDRIGFHDSSGNWVPGLKPLEENTETPEDISTDVLSRNHRLTFSDYQAVYDVHVYVATIRQEEQLKDNFSERYQIISLTQNAVSVALDALQLLARIDRQSTMGKD